MSTVQNEYECYECKFNPNYHSFHYLTENNEEIYYYKIGIIQFVK